MGRGEQIGTGPWPPDPTPWPPDHHKGSAGHLSWSPGHPNSLVRSQPNSALLRWPPDPSPWSPGHVINPNFRPTCKEAQKKLKCNRGIRNPMHPRVERTTCNGSVTPAIQGGGHPTNESGRPTTPPTHFLRAPTPITTNRLQECISTVGWSKAAR